MMNEIGDRQRNWQHSSNDENASLPPFWPFENVLPALRLINIQKCHPMGQSLLCTYGYAVLTMPDSLWTINSMVWIICRNRRLVIYAAKIHMYPWKWHRNVFMEFVRCTEQPVRFVFIWQWMNECASLHIDWSINNSNKRRGIADSSRHSIQCCRCACAGHNRYSTWLWLKHVFRVKIEK